MTWSVANFASAVAVVASFGASQASALDRNDTMSVWLHASDADRSRLLDELLAHDRTVQKANPKAVAACLDAAAKIPGHGELRIGDVADACSEQSSPDGTGQTDT